MQTAAAALQCTNHFAVYVTRSADSRPPLYARAHTRNKLIFALAFARAQNICKTPPTKEMQPLNGNDYQRRMRSLGSLVSVFLVAHISDFSFGRLAFNTCLLLWHNEIDSIDVVMAAAGFWRHTKINYKTPTVDQRSLLTDFKAINCFSLLLFELSLICN